MTDTPPSELKASGAPLDLDRLEELCAKERP